MGPVTLPPSTRISAAACLNGQATYDLTQWDKLIGPFRAEWKKDANEDAMLYHFSSPADLKTEAGKRVLAECDMLRWISKDDPPIFMSCNMPDGEPENRGQYVHHPRHAKAVKARCDEVGEPCEIALSSGGGDAAPPRSRARQPANQHPSPNGHHPAHGNQTGRFRPDGPRSRWRPPWIQSFLHPCCPVLRTVGNPAAPMAASLVDFMFHLLF